MTRTHYMTMGLVLIFIGIQLYSIDTYVLTSEATEFIQERLGSEENESNDAMQQSAYQQPFFQASYSTAQTQTATQPAKEITPPRWLCWPIGFLGSVLTLHGLAMRRND